MKKKTVNEWGVIIDGELCFATEETESPLAIFSDEFDGEFLARVLARDIGDGAQAVRITITYETL